MQQRGFTLIEIMIVVVIIGIISAIAMPSYTNYVRESRRAEAMTLISQVISAQERFYIEQRTYTADLTDLGFASAANLATEADWYTVSAAACAGSTLADCVLVTATAQNDQAADGNLTLDSTGRKTGHWND